MDGVVGCIIQKTGTNFAGNARKIRQVLRKRDPQVIILLDVSKHLIDVCVHLFISILVTTLFNETKISQAEKKKRRKDTFNYCFNLQFTTRFYTVGRAF